MKRMIFLLIVCATNHGLSLGQDDSLRFGGRTDATKPTVYLEYMCQGENIIFLRLRNNTFWHLEVVSGLYFPTKKPITLLNGNKTYAAPNNEPIKSLFYRVEVDEGARIPNTKIPKSARTGLGNDGGGAWIAPSDSIYFPVPIEYLREGRKVAVSFKYEWEIPKDGHRIDDPEHRVFFTGRSLSNTKPIGCSSMLG